MRRDFRAGGKGKRGRRWGYVLVSLVILGYMFVHWGNWEHAYARRRGLARQRAQLRAIGEALESFRKEHGSYPPSDANDSVGSAYCGATRLAEVLLAGHAYPKSGNAVRLVDIYGKGKTGPFSEDAIVVCDTYARLHSGGAKSGMPILYYRANPSGKAHQAGDLNNIYDCRDNHTLLALELYFLSGEPHPLIDPKRFYLNTQNPLVTVVQQPFHPDSYILISAGRDSVYGTADDICNFEWKYREE